MMSPKLRDATIDLLFWHMASAITNGHSGSDAFLLGVIEIRRILRGTDPALIEAVISDAVRHMEELHRQPEVPH
jgi:hypothetical protein